MERDGKSQAEGKKSKKPGVTGTNNDDDNVLTKFSHDIVLNGNVVEWADEWPYLGVSLKSGKVFSCSVTDRIKKFY